MDKVLLLCIWLAMGLLLIAGVVILHLRNKTPLALKLKGLGIEINIQSGSKVSENTTTMRLEE